MFPKVRFPFESPRGLVKVHNLSATPHLLKLNLQRWVESLNFSPRPQVTQNQDFRVARVCDVLSGRWRGKTLPCCPLPGQLCPPGKGKRPGLGQPFLGLFCLRPPAWVRSGRGVLTSCCPSSSAQSLPPALQEVTPNFGSRRDRWGWGCGH